MKFLFDAADRYLKASDWKDIAVLKFCLISLGLMAGTQVPQKHREAVQSASLIIFLVTYIPLMGKFFRILLEKPKTEEA